MLSLVCLGVRYFQTSECMYVSGTTKATMTDDAGCCGSVDNTAAAGSLTERKINAVFNQHIDLCVGVSELR